MIAFARAWTSSRWREARPSSAIKEELYGAPGAAHHRQEDETQWLFPAKGALNRCRLRWSSPGDHRRVDAPDIHAKIAELEPPSATPAPPVRDRAIPYFCAGCPHNSSTIVPEGARAYAGIGCHFMAQWMDRSTEGFTQMGGEGANWVGEAPFSKRRHVFQNLGDGTYIHSGSLAVRASVASGVNVTYKLLYNDAVANDGWPGARGRG